VGAEEDPVEVVVRLSRNLMGEPVLAHSTSWRRDRGSVVLSFVVVIGEDQAPALAGAEVARSELARSSATAAPAAIASAQVLEHGLRHLAWLAKEDEVDREVLSPEWHGILSGYVLEQRGGGRRVRNPGGIALRGRDQVREYMPILWSAFPDMKVSQTYQVIAGDTAVTEATYSGTHTGTLPTPNGDVPATGKRVQGRQVAVQRVKDGQISSEQLYFDQMEFLGALGLVPSPSHT
jgi:predicted ester cyclase